MSNAAYLSMISKVTDAIQGRKRTIVQPWDYPASAGEEVTITSPALIDDLVPIATYAAPPDYDHCEYCHSLAVADARGNCSSCGATLLVRPPQLSSPERATFFGESYCVAVSATGGDYTAPIHKWTPGAS